MEKKYSAPAVEKLLDIIELLSKDSRGFSINEISRLLSIPVNSVYRICKEMEDRQYIDKNTDTGLYQLGSKFFIIGQVVGSRIDLRNKALPIMKHLRDQSGETVHLAILQGNRMVLLDQMETEQPIRIHVESGSVMYTHASAFGKCLLAFSPEETVRQIIEEGLLEMTPYTITDPGEFKKELARIREEEIAYDREEYMMGIQCVGAPVHGTLKKGIAAIGVMGPRFRFGDSRLKEVAPYVQEAAVKLSHDMGFW